ncbi:hypothetical protein ACFVY9_00790 [Streptomyces sp. NPDC059544]|uniref:hypothetical protein n=1 Tax=Streptomyces sp. NPDC059544 TaxID=3346861 RepID=UPI0036C355CA
MSTSYTPLFDPEKDAYLYVPTLDHAIERAREVLDEKSRANIHDSDQMIRAAVGLDHVLRDLLAALSKKENDQ